MEYVAFEKGIEVNGQTVYSVVDGFKAFTLMAAKFLLTEGIGTPSDGGLVKIEPEAWYSQEAWLRAFHKIGEQVGDAALKEIGMAIPRNAKFPPWVTDIHSGVKSIDIAYHMNHRKQGSEMFDPKTGTMLEGIGHYGYAAIEGKKEIRSNCDNPYPCAFDQGIVTAMARRFERAATVSHDPNQPCRKKGGRDCTYVVTW